MFFLKQSEIGGEMEAMFSEDRTLALMREGVPYCLRFARSFEALLRAGGIFVSA